MIKSPLQCNENSSYNSKKRRWTDKKIKYVVVEIENSKEKIHKIEEEIEAIISNDPYKFKFILDDFSAIKRKKDELESDIEEYQEYLEELLGKLNEFNIQKELLN